MALMKAGTNHYFKIEKEKKMDLSALLRLREKSNFDKRKALIDWSV